ncbi:hypothetical protein KAI46_07130 [bacterium]|nr:hypothetical protein [bacterium]
MSALEKYEYAVTNLPASGGDGCNLALLGAANHGVYAGIDPQQIHDDLRNHVHGSRHVSDQEISRAIKKAQHDKGDNVVHYNFEEKKIRPVFNSEAARNKIMALGAGVEEADIWEASPVRIDWGHKEDPINLLSHLYQDDDLIFMGERYSSGKLGKTIMTATEWQQYFRSGGKTLPHIIPNPLTGEKGLTRDGKPTLRGDSCIKSFRYAVVEFDNISREEQFAFWWGVNLPVAALIDSGNKSIHGWVKIDGIDDTETWTEQVEQELFKNLLVPLGVDGACKNEARLSRLPGHQRNNGRRQRLLYLAPEGRRVKK